MSRKVAGTDGDDGPRDVELSSTEAQNRFGDVLRVVREGGRVTVRRHGRPEAVLLSVEELRQIEERVPSMLPELDERFDALVARMREEGSHEALDRALASGPEALRTRIPPPGE